MQFEFLRVIVGLLDEAEIPHMLAGSMASTFHGEPRMTRDIDMVIDPSQASAERFITSLKASGYYVDDLAGAVTRRGMANVIDTSSGWKVDLVVRKDRPFSREEFRRRQPASIGGVEVFVATAEDTVLAKLEWRSRSESEQQWRDVVSVLSTGLLDTAYLRRWAVDLGVADDLERALREASG